MARKRRKPGQPSSPPSVTSISVDQLVSRGGAPLTDKSIKEAFASTYAAPFRFLRPLFCGSDPCAPLRNCRLDFRPASRRTPDDTMMIVHSNAEQGFWMTIQSNEEDKYIIHIYPYRSIAPMEQEKLIIEKNVLMRVINDCLSTQERHKAAPSMFPFL